MEFTVSNKRARKRPSAFEEEELDDGGSCPLSVDMEEEASRFMEAAAIAAEEGDLRKALGQFGNAAALLCRMGPAESVSSNKRRAEVAEMSAQLLNELGEFFSAVKQAELSVRLLPDWPVAHQTLGRAQMNLRDYPSALQSFETALSLDGNFHEVQTCDLPWARSMQPALGDEDEDEDGGVLALN